MEGETMVAHIVLSWALLKKAAILAVGLLSPFFTWGFLLLYSEFSLRSNPVLLGM
jgi:hypothetical protein